MSSLVSPFKFLNAYDKQDKDVFFGRETETEEIYERLFKSNLLLLYGASGTGKTSILNCGIANEFAETDSFPISIRRAENIIVSLRRELKSVAETEIGPKLSLTEAVKSVYLDYFKPVFLMFDQFEELFISGQPGEQEEFLSFLKDLLGSEVNARVILIIREEYLAHFSAFEEEIPNLFDNRYRVEHMTRLRAEDIIIKTCKKYGIQLRNSQAADAALQMQARQIAREIIANISTKSNFVQLTYLQVYLDRLFKKFTEVYPEVGHLEEVVFSSELVAKLRNIEHVFSLFLDEQVGLLDKKGLAWIVLKGFITQDPVKQTITKQTVSASRVHEILQAEGKKISLEEIMAYIADFLKIRILREVDSERKTYELLHDSLALRIWERIGVVAQEQIKASQFLENAYKDYKTQKDYLSDAKLAYLRQYAGQIAITHEQEDFIRKSQWRLVRRRWIITGSLIALVIILVGGILSLKSKNDKISDQTSRLNAQKDSLQLQLRTIRQLEKNRMISAQASFLAAGFTHAADSLGVQIRAIDSPEHSGLRQIDNSKAINP